MAIKKSIGTLPKGAEEFNQVDAQSSSDSSVSQNDKRFVTKQDATSLVEQVLALSLDLAQKDILLASQAEDIALLKQQHGEQIAILFDKIAAIEKMTGYWERTIIDKGVNRDKIMNELTLKIDAQTKVVADLKDTVDGHSIKITSYYEEQKKQKEILSVPTNPMASKAVVRQELPKDFDFTPYIEAGTILGNTDQYSISYCGSLDIILSCSKAGKKLKKKWETVGINSETLAITYRFT